MPKARPTSMPAEPSGAARPFQTFSDKADRVRLTPAAVEAIRNLMKQWNVSGNEMAALLGVSGSTVDRITQRKRPLSQDQLMRVSALVGIFKGLQLLFVNDMADRWPQLPNAGPVFANRTPIEAMLDGGIPTMLEVRRYVDALRGGL